MAQIADVDASRVKKGVPGREWMAQEFQIGGNLSREEGGQLKVYSERLELTRPNLCALLVVRELACERLSELQALHSGSGPKKGAARVTARVSMDTKQRFEMAANRVSLGLDDAAAILFRAELAERWLERSLQTS